LEPFSPDQKVSTGFPERGEGDANYQLTLRSLPSSFTLRHECFNERIFFGFILAMSTEAGGGFSAFLANAERSPPRGNSVGNVRPSMLFLPQFSAKIG
jgi:hypothetical protein